MAAYPLKRIITAMTKPRITMVSGIASMMMTVPRSSGFRAIVPAPAAPRRDWAQAVARLDTPIARAADSMSRPLSMVLLLSRRQGERLVGPSSIPVELVEELHVVETKSLDRGAEAPHHEVHRVEQHRDCHADHDREDPRHLVGHLRQHHRGDAQGHQPRVGEDV